MDTPATDVLLRIQNALGSTAPLTPPLAISYEPDRHVVLDPLPEHLRRLYAFLQESHLDLVRYYSWHESDTIALQPAVLERAWRDWRAAAGLFLAAAEDCGFDPERFEACGATTGWMLYGAPHRPESVDQMTIFTCALQAVYPDALIKSVDVDHTFDMIRF